MSKFEEIATRSSGESRIARTFAELGRRDRVALVAYLTAGDPSFEESAELVLAAARAGADLIELGVPWSDPSADGPVIQRAMGRALAGAGPGVVGRVFEVIRRVRQQSQVPIVLFGYFNPLLQYGLTRAVTDAAAAGVDAFLVVDLPPEEATELDDALDQTDLVRIPLLAPTTSPLRAKLVVARGGGFAYYVGLAGVTGAGHLDAAEVGRRTAELRPSLRGLPLCVGFGIKEPSQLAALTAHCDGIVVGSALVQAVEAAPTPATRIAAVEKLIAALSAATPR